METSYSINEMSGIFWPRPFECNSQAVLSKQTYTKTFHPFSHVRAERISSLMDNAIYVPGGGVEMQVTEGEVEVEMTSTGESFMLRQGDFIMLSAQGLLLFKCDNPCTVMMTMATSMRGVFPS